jgi:3-oxoacyl-[acyl-carrier protein] reductase
MPAERELDGKVCVVTGGGRGIGAEIAATFAAQGGRIALLERDEQLAEATRERLAAQGADVRAYRADVADEDAVAGVAERVLADFGAVDVLVNNAGVARLGPSMSYSVADFRETLDIMATGVFICSREFGRAMRDGDGGAIVNISSIAAIAAFPMRLAYAVAKGGVIAMTKVLANEWAGFGIRVNAVAPGIIETEMVRATIEQGLIDVETYLGRTPLRRFGHPADIAEAVLYLASPRSSFMTGQVIVSDGGWTNFGWIPWTGDPESPVIPREQ